MVGEQVDVFVAGSLAIDLSCDYDPIIRPGNDPSLRTSNPAVISQSVGGVGQNVAVAAHYAGANVRFCSIVGQDEAGKAAISSLRQKGLDSSSINILGDGKRTAQYVAVNDARKDLVIAMADMKIFEDNEHGFERRWRCHLDRCKPRWLIVDGNWDSQTLQKWIHAGKSAGANVAYEPVSVEKSSRIFPLREMSFDKDSVQQPSSYDRPDGWSPAQLVDLATPNEIELRAMSQHVQASNACRPLLTSASSRDGLLRHLERRKEESFRGVDIETLLAAIHLIPYVPCLITKLGSRGVLLTERLRVGDSRLSSPDWAKHVLFHEWEFEEGASDVLTTPMGKPRSDGVYMRHFPPTQTVPTQDIVSVNGVGDTFLGVLVAALCRRSASSIGELIEVAQKAAALTLQSTEPVSVEVKGIWG